jgi:hypothetical protein
MRFEADGANKGIEIIGQRADRGDQAAIAFGIGAVRLCFDGAEKACRGGRGAQGVLAHPDN